MIIFNSKGNSDISDSWSHGKESGFFCFCFWLLLKFPHCLWNCWWDLKHALVYWDECQFILQSGYEKSQSRSRNILVWDKRWDHHHHHPSRVEPSHQHCFFLKRAGGKAFITSMQPSLTSDLRDKGGLKSLGGVQSCQASRVPRRVTSWANSRERPWSRTVLLGTRIPLLTSLCKVDYTVGRAHGYSFMYFMDYTLRDSLSLRKMGFCNDSNQGRKSCLFFLGNRQDMT